MGVYLQITGAVNGQETLKIIRCSVCESPVNDGIVGVYWVEKGPMVLQAIGG